VVPTFYNDVIRGDFTVHLADDFFEISATNLLKQMDVVCILILELGEKWKKNNNYIFFSKLT